MKKTNQLISAFASGISVNAYELLGCHIDKGVFIFRVWAPNAKSVSLVGDFNEWNENANHMINIGHGIWEGIIDNAKIYDNYKYAITSQNGKTVLKSDPYAFHTATRPDAASKDNHAIIVQNSIEEGYTTNAYIKRDGNAWFRGNVTVDGTIANADIDTKFAKVDEKLSEAKNMIAKSESIIMELKAENTDLKNKLAMFEEQLAQVIAQNNIEKTSQKISRAFVK